ncbi:hypothetical protein Patl1_20227 [Pistacia atlantica]|uniref:Uncharacterized protein n=1 Tax=Pistacia atlantica TaxID=434234 RepID=A0ACC1BJL8_9ROSI|nr:hypothetical protein Patl1_20227 [Pistacia atlantica]
MFMASLICNMDADCDKLLVCKLELDCVKTLQFDTELHNNYGKYCRTSQEFALSSHSSDVSTTYFMGKSPFPALDKFIECIASIGDVSVMYVVDLRRAVYYQKCYDPDCRGYRSPLRPIPLDSIPDPMFSSDSRQMMQHGGLTDNNIEYQLVNNYWEQDMSCYDDDNTESCGKDSWWIEAINLADDIENKQKTWDSSNMANIDDEDDGWWMAVERTASQAELMHFN